MSCPSRGNGAVSPRKVNIELSRFDIDGTNAAMADLGIACELTAGALSAGITRVGKTRQGRAGGARVESVDKQKTGQGKVPSSAAVTRIFGGQIKRMECRRRGRGGGGLSRVAASGPGSRSQVSSH
ncbi:hypothetical protein ONS96_006136 [Cadophora gregata f. sp. sojae]|nr:hypothetical protein ONS96_006136 [Cadophora gregata f. sp. sojae]